jgi:long-subunit acyl-CoA synthetase (AMP-forming)
MMAIEMAGCVYCPLSAEDPRHRLQTLVHQTQCRLVLIHWLTRTKFDDDILFFDIGSIMVNDGIYNDIDIDILLSVLMTPDNIACIIFTSGSTGTPKGVSHVVMTLYHTISSVSFIDRFKFEIEI